MKYYLETNALRALGSKIQQNQELLRQSYTSIFSIFELIKGIGRSSDSQRRKEVLAVLKSTDLGIIEAMPFEIMKAGFTDYVHKDETKIITNILGGLIADDSTTLKDYDDLVERYESSTLDFQAKSNDCYVRPKPEPEYIRIDLKTMLSEPKIDIPEGVKNLPEGVHASRIAMEYLKLTSAPKYFHILFNNENITDEEIHKIYNDKLDLFFFSSHAYELKKNCLRESAAKNDWLDVLHTVYLFNHDSIMVSNDKLFESILPNINLISIEDFKNKFD